MNDDRGELTSARRAPRRRGSWLGRNRRWLDCRVRAGDGLDPWSVTVPDVRHPAVSQARDDLHRRGYTVLPALPPPLVRTLAGRYRDLGLPDDHGFFATCNDSERGEATQVDLHLRRALAPFVEGVFPGLVPFLGAFVSKQGGDGGSMAFHQDLTYVDERRHRSLNAWVPLVDVDRRSGALLMVPGSHRLTSGLRPGGTAPLPTTSHQDALGRLAVAAEVPAGSMVVFDSALIHGSAPNTAPGPRPAASVVFAPRGAPLVHFHRREGGPLEGFEIDDRFFTTQTFRSRPRDYPQLTVWGPALAEADVARAIDTLSRA